MQLLFHGITCHDIRFMIHWHTSLNTNKFELTSLILCLDCAKADMSAEIDYKSGREIYDYLR